MSLINHIPALTNIVRRIAVEAGLITLEYFDESGTPNPTYKEDGSPVTQADQLAEKLIYQKLLEVVPEIPVIGEEAMTAGAIPELNEAGYAWLVDPLDGTRAFVAGDPDFTVNIALIKNNIPIIGVIHAPYLGETYWAYRGGVAKRYFEDSDTEREISVRPIPLKGLTVITSKTHDRPGKTSALIDLVKLERRIKRSSAVKFGLLASGKVDLYPRFGPTSYWDTAAGQVIVEAAGGVVVDMEGHSLCYDISKPSLLNPDFIACGDGEFIRKILAPDESE